MKFQIANRLLPVKPSATMAVAAKAQRLKAAGQDIISLSVGEPDFDTPDYIKAAGIAAIQKGFTKYTAVDGIGSLKAAIIKKLATENQLQYEPAQVMVSCGVKQGLYNLMQVLLNPGDEVIIPGPYWVSYPDMVLLAEGTPVIVPTSFDQHFKLTPQMLDAAITPNTKLLIINSPSNPSGLAYTRSELAALGEVLLKHPQVLIATDDMYEHILWGDEPFVNIVNACPALYERTLVFNGVSKSYAMTGWRIGYVAGDREIISAMTTVQSQSTSNPTSISQVAAEAALLGDQQCVRDMAVAYERRHALLLAGLQAMPGVRCWPSQGTFYCLPDFSAVIAKMGMQSDLEMAEYLLDKAGVAVVPGSAFGAENCLRLSFATSDEVLRQALARIEQALLSKGKM